MFTTKHGLAVFFKQMTLTVDRRAFMRKHGHRIVRYFRRSNMWPTDRNALHSCGKIKSSKRPCIEFGVVRIDSAIVVCIHSAIIQLLLTRRSRPKTSMDGVGTRPSAPGSKTN